MIYRCSTGQLIDEAESLWSFTVDNGGFFDLTVGRNLSYLLRVQAEEMYYTSLQSPDTWRGRHTCIHLSREAALERQQMIILPFANAKLILFNSPSPNWGWWDGVHLCRWWWDGVHPADSITGEILAFSWVCKMSDLSIPEKWEKGSLSCCLPILGR